MARSTSRRSFVQSGGACGLALLAAQLFGAEQAPPEIAVSPTPDDLTNKVNPQQVMNFLKQIDGSGDESLKTAVFGRWGRECFYSRKLDEWARQYRDNLDAFLAYVNDGHSRYWERLDYDRAAATLRVTSRKYPHCVCAYAQCQQPPRSLCAQCCRAFHTELWATVFGKSVSVEIPESILLGGARCRTIIRVLPS